MSSSHGTESLWAADVTLPRFPTLDTVDVDVVVVGGGISGLTTALLLQRSGYTTAVLEQQHLGSGESGRTSAHLTEFPDAGYARLATDFGIDGAKAVARSKREAIDLIDSLADDLKCDFRRVPGYLVAENSAGLDRLAKEAACSREAGVTVRELGDAPLPFRTAGALEFPNQAQFHPLKYLSGLVRLYAQAGGRISEGAHVRSIDEEEEGRCRVRTDRGISLGRHVVITTDAPITGGALLDTKLEANRSFVIAARVPVSHAPNGLFWDTDEPYHYIRAAITADEAVVIVGGEDHRVGYDSEAGAFERLQQYLSSHFPVQGILRRWSGQIMEPVDGLPYIGAREERSRVLLATGYSGNGLTFGTVAAQLLTDIICGRSNPYAELYAPNRILAARRWAKYAAQNLPTAWALVTDKLPGPLAASVEDLAPGEGRVIRVNGQRTAAARDLEGRLHLISSTCTHMGCEVAWNVVEQTWDCPCHGSRYEVDGTVIHGPATASLQDYAAVVGVPVTMKRPARSK